MYQTFLYSLYASKDDILETYAKRLKLYKICEWKICKPLKNVRIGTEFSILNDGHA